MNIQWIGSHPNNYDVGRKGSQIKYVVLHWIVGTLESADATFQKSDRFASATYGIGDSEIHQYVNESDTSYANGNLISNRESITIEHEGGWELPDGTRLKPTPQTHETSAGLVADICKRYRIPIDRNHIKGHREISSTQCPGTLDIDQIITRAKELSAIIIPTMDADKQKGIDKLDQYRKERKQGAEGNYESYVGAIIGSDKDIIGKDQDLQSAKGTIDRLNSQITALETTVKINGEAFDSIKKQLKIAQDALADEVNKPPASGKVYSNPVAKFFIKLADLAES